MITTLLSIMAIILVAMGVILCIKQTIFFSLITKNSQNKTFLSTFGVIFIFLGMICLLVGFFNQLEWAITFFMFYVSHFRNF